MDDQSGRSLGDMRGDVRPRRRWLRRLGWLLLIVLLGVGGWYAWTALRPAEAPGRQRGAAQAPQPVGAATISRGDVPVVLNALGTVTSLATVTVKTQIAGKIVQLGFKEGQLVQKGDFLVQIDPRPYQVALEQAQGALARDQAQLRNAQLDLTRYRTLLSQDSVARQQVDTQAALVRQYSGTIQTDQAAIDSAKLNLEYCRIVAPVGGRVGLRQVDEGNYVQPSDANGLVVIAQLQPISVIFTLPEDQIPQVSRAMHAGRTLPVEAWDRANLNRLATGELLTTDNQVDTTTGTVKLRAGFANADEGLFPNQFVNARLLVDTLRNVVVAPGAAIQRGEPGTFVYLIGDDGVVHVRKVRLGPTSGQTVAILDGLQGGEKVVVDGADRLRDGAKVTVPPPPGGTAQQGGQPPGAQPTATQPQDGQPAGGQRGRGRRGEGAEGGGAGQQSGGAPAAQ